jgi:hypothetical protein
MERYTLTQRFTEERVLALTEQRTILLAEAAEEKNAALLEQRAVLESAAAEDKAAALKELKFLLESVAAEDKARALAAQKAALEAAAAKAQARSSAAARKMPGAERMGRIAGHQAVPDRPRSAIPLLPAPHPAPPHPPCARPRLWPPCAPAWRPRLPSRLPRCGCARACGYPQLWRSACFPALSSRSPVERRAAIFQVHGGPAAAVLLGRRLGIFAAVACLACRKQPGSSALVASPAQRRCSGSL